MIAPAGSVDSPQVSDRQPQTVMPAKNGWIPVLNGDGMVYRLDFHKTPTTRDRAESSQDCPLKVTVGKAWLANCLIKTPSYYVGHILHDCPDRYKNLSKGLQFITWGIARLSIGFGARNQNNTSLLPMKFARQSERLLVTEDIGRPWEIDPYTLKLLAPVGLNQDWTGVIQNPLWRFWTFPPVMTTAHAIFDPNTAEVFTTNVVKSLSTLLDVSLWFAYKIHELKIPLRKQLAKLFHNLHNRINLAFANKLRFDENYVYLLRWDGKEHLKKWQVVLSDGSAAKIEQTLHQMGLTEKYIVLADTSLKIALDDFIPRKNRIQEAEVFWRELTSFPQSSKTTLYIVPRDKLNPQAQTVKAQKVELPEALVHYLVDYKNPGEKIIFHTAHMNAWDTAEFVHGVDRLAKSSGQHPHKSDEPVIGMVTTSTDVSRLTSYVIDAKTGELSRTDVSYESLPKSKYPWSPAFYAYRDDADRQPVEQYQDIYWNSWGLWGDLLTDFIYDMYKDYQPRIQAIAEVLEQAKTEGIAAQLCRVHIDRAPEVRLKISDRYQFPSGYFGTSAQFVPREGVSGQTAGYIVCIVIYSDRLLSYDEAGENPANWSDNSEIWIFDAENLEQGPKYKMSHAKLNFGFTAHTTWLREIKSPPAREYDVRQDYEDWLNNLNRNWMEYLLGFMDDPIDPEESLKELRELFERDVYPHFDSHSGDRHPA